MLRQAITITILVLAAAAASMTIHISRQVQKGDHSLGRMTPTNEDDNTTTASSSTREQEVQDTSLSSQVNNETTSSRLDFQPILYQNLSCPFEWSKFSCFWHGREERAQAAWDYAHFHINKAAVALKKRQKWTTASAATTQQSSSARLILVGDSTMRQVFIALGCRFWNDADDRLADYALPWLDNWPCRSINCIPSGAHSGFIVSSLRLTSGAEIHFLPHSGYQKDAQGQNPAEPGIVQRWKQELLIQPSDHSNNANSSTSTPPLGKLRLGPHAAMPSQYSEFLSANDTIVFNLGLHREQNRTTELKDFADFGRKLLTLPSMERPQLIYLATVTQHFRTKSGAHEHRQRQRLLGQEQQQRRRLQCQPAVEANQRRDEERQLLLETVHVDHFLDYDTLDTGNLHIGGGDCTHYCMPGPPDVVAEKLVQLWLQNR